VTTSLHWPCTLGSVAYLDTHPWCVSVQPPTRCRGLSRGILSCWRSHPDQDDYPFHRILDLPQCDRGSVSL